MKAFTFALAATAVGLAIATLWVVGGALSFLFLRWCAKLMGWY
jgi:hypothetical protein